MKDLGIYNDSPKDKGKKKVFPGREDHDRPCSNKRWESRRFWIFMSLLWCAVAFLFGYAKGFQNAEAGQKDSRIVFRKSPAVEFAMLVLLNLEKGITVKVDAQLHAQVREYIEAHGMTMSEFVAKALDSELHPSQTRGGVNMANRTIAFTGRNRPSDPSRPPRHPGVR